MIRRLLNLFTLLSLLLCVAVAVLWVRSYRHQDMIGWGFWGHDAQNRENQERWFAGIEGNEGVLAVGALREREGDPIEGPLVRAASGFFWNEFGWPLNMFIGAAEESFGFAFLWLNSDPTPRYLGHHGVIVCIPFWAAAIVATSLSVAGCRSIQRHRRRLQRATVGLCPTCGYDLRGNVSGVCPECGDVAKASGGSDGRPPNAGVSAEALLPPLWQRVVAWALVWVAAAMIILAAWPDLRNVLFMGR